MSGDFSSLASRSDAVSLLTEISAGLAPVTDITVDRQSAHENYPSDLMARNAPDTPLVPNRSDVLSDVRDLPSPLSDTLRGVPSHRPCLVPSF